LKRRNSKAAVKQEKDKGSDLTPFAERSQKKRTKKSKIHFKMNKISILKAKT
jgi:hypothetical protein